MFNFLRRWFFKTSRHSWRAYRYGGGGVASNKDMTEEEAIQWVRGITDGDITFIDRELGFIFYRPKE